MVLKKLAKTAIKKAARDRKMYGRKATDKDKYLESKGVEVPRKLLSAIRSGKSKKTVDKARSDFLKARKIKPGTLPSKKDFTKFSNVLKSSIAKKGIPKMKKRKS